MSALRQAHAKPVALLAYLAISCAGFGSSGTIQKAKRGGGEEAGGLTGPQDALVTNHDHVFRSQRATRWMSGRGCLLPMGTALTRLIPAYLGRACSLRACLRCDNAGLLARVAVTLQVLKMSEAPKAIKLIEQGDVMGKVVCAVGGELLRADP